MDNIDITKVLNDVLVDLFNRILKIEEEAIKSSSRHNLSITEIHTLAAIGTGAAKTMSQVSSALRISISTLTIAVGKLVEKKYVERFRVPEDRRIVKIALTGEGQTAVLEHEEFHRRMIEDILAGMSEAQRKVLAQSLSQLNEFFRAQEEKTAY